MRGNLEPDGAVMKQSAVATAMHFNEGRARVFGYEDDAIASILGGEIKDGDIVIIRHEGPKGGLGMREVLGPTSAIVSMGLDKTVALLTDGRFSGDTQGAAIGHISPETAEGGPIALVKEGDIITINIPEKNSGAKGKRQRTGKREKVFETFYAGNHHRLPGALCQAGYFGIDRRNFLASSLLILTSDFPVPSTMIAVTEI